ncbi:acyltransferase [Novosphingobium sp. KCTC 2891]|uniref:acyltransferase family protein n=1 Tax=Novosphingobium sp. KCTC 2891 TaxID=2989730 RepID=UPI0022215271|nr:acyltransferase [Novosphingobium sp. KCTC 2891]MCW1381861.1 acyltransferase [Novosphingobium sp. KCTC 2891]
MQERPHFEVLDGLRGVAALLVLVFHVSEILAMGDPTRNLLPHGALAVDFFFCLSGFVVSYAYDRRWAQGMTLREFALRRLIRLHPLVVLATVIGAAAYFLGPWRGPDWHVSPVQAATTVALALLVLPYPTLPGRWTDTHSLDGPTWTLFQEYVGNLAYALVLRRLGNAALLMLAAVAGVLLAWAATRHGTLSLGFGWDTWAMAFVRLAFPFIFGLWLHRALPALPRWRVGLVPLALVMTAALALPVAGAGKNAMANGALDAALVIALFPAIVLLGAHSSVGPRTLSAARTLGRLSYPLYILHYPFIYKFADYAIFGKPSDTGILVGALTLPFALVALGWAGLKLWDEPLRARLSARFLRRR